MIIRIESKNSPWKRLIVLRSANSKCLRIHIYRVPSHWQHLALCLKMTKMHLRLILFYLSAAAHLARLFLDFFFFWRPHLKYNIIITGSNREIKLQRHLNTDSSIKPVIYYLQIVNVEFLLLETKNSGENPAFLIRGPNPTFATRLPKPITTEIKLEDFGTYIYISIIKSLPL